MRGNREQWLRISNRLLSGAMALLGFSACGSNGENPVEYGQPHADYEIKGSVTDEAGNELADMRIITKTLLGEVPDNPYLRDTVTTNAAGAFLLEKKNETSEGRYRVVCEDPAGVYKADSTDIQMKPKGGKGWYQGSDSKEVEFQLKKRNAE